MQLIVSFTLARHRANTTPNVMVLGELGRFTIEIKAKLRMISFWSRLIQSEYKLSSILYKLMLSLYEQNQQNFKWIKCVESIFNEVGLGYIFQNQVGYFDKNMVKQILWYQFIQKWHSDINNSSRGQFYSGFKNDFFLENYLLRLSEYNKKWITKFRTSNLRLPIETGRWYNLILKNISQSDFIKYRLHAFNSFESLLILFIQGQH
jgi:hypothetical protein